MKTTADAIRGALAIIDCRTSRQAEGYARALSKEDLTAVAKLLGTSAQPKAVADAAIGTALKFAGLRFDGRPREHDAHMAKHRHDMIRRVKSRA